MTDQNINNKGPQTPKKGQIIDVTVVKIDYDNKSVLVETPFKHDGQIPISEFQEKELKKLKEGTVFKAMVVWHEGQTLTLSKAKADLVANWKLIQEAYNQKRLIIVQILRKEKKEVFRTDRNDATKKIKKEEEYYIGDYLGHKVILPSWEVSRETFSETQELVGLKLPVKIIRINPKDKSIIVSEKRYKLEELAKKREEFLENLDIGVIFEGKVIRIDKENKYFLVSKDGIKGKLKFENISWDRYQNPIEKVRPGDIVRTVVVDYDKENQDIWLSIKDLEDDFWEEVDKYYHVGQEVEGKVYRLFDFGAIIDLDDKFRALVPNEEITLTKIVRNPEEIVKKGDTLKGIIIDIDKDNRKIKVSVKDYILKKYKVGDIVKGKVINVKPYGAFIELEPGVTGLLKVENISWTNKIKNATKVLKVGEIVEAKILNINPEKKQIDFGIKQILPNPWDELKEKYHVGDSVKGTVVKIIESGAFININEEIDAFLHVSKIPVEEGENWQDKIHIGDEIEGTIIVLDTEEKKLQISLIKEEKEKTSSKKKNDETKSYVAENKDEEQTLLSDELLNQLKESIKEKENKTENEEEETETQPDNNEEEGEK